MSYVKIVNYAAKDILITGDPNKLVSGTEINNEFAAVATASAVTDAAYVAADALKLDTATAATTYAPLASPALTGVPTAPTATVGTNTTQLATMAALLNQAFTASLPSQTGNSGKVLTTNGTTPSWATAGATGGTTITASITLTSTSAASMVVTPATPGLYATLPDSTTLTKGMSQFAIYNAGEYDYGVKNSAGTVLGWIRPQVGAVFGLADNAAAAGIWNLTNVEKLGATAIYRSEAGTTNGVAIRPVTIDSTRELFIFGSATTIYGIVFDASANSWGTAVLIRAATVANVAAILSAANQILVVSCDTTTGFQGVTLTIDGTGITVNNTAASAVLAGNISTFGNLVALGTSWVQGYCRATNVIGIRALSISGTAVTIGNEYAQTPAAALSPILLVTGSNLRVVSMDGTILSCAPYTVSGVFLTVGVEANVATNSSQFRAFVNGNGNVVVEYFHSSAHRAAIFKLTAGTEAISVATMAAITTTIGNTGYTVISASKTLFALAGSTNSFNILTDNAGTASVGTAVTSAVGVTATAPLCSPSVVSNVARVTTYSGTNLYSFNIDCSGTSPVISSTKEISNGNNFVTVSQDKYGVLSARSFCFTNVDYALNPTGTSARITANSLSQYVNFPQTITPTYKGNSDSISWAIDQVSTTTGISLQRIEATA